MEPKEGSSEMVNKIKVLQKNEVNRNGFKLYLNKKLSKSLIYCKNNKLWELVLLNVTKLKPYSQHFFLHNSPSGSKSKSVTYTMLERLAGTMTS
jgi:hypothetical protein